MSIHSLLENLTHVPVLFFFLGLLAVALRSDLEMPPQIAKFLSLYLLFDIGIKGGEELFHSGLTRDVLVVMVACAIMSFIVPFLVHKILRLRLDAENAGAIAATYGSISAVTFATAVSFLDSQKVVFHGYMVAGMALMESPAIIAGLLLIRLTKGGQHEQADEAKSQSEEGDSSNALEGLGSLSKAPTKEDEEHSKKHPFLTVLHEAFFNGSVFLLVGSLVIGFVGGSKGEADLKPFVSDIFKGMLCLYMLDMGLLAGKRLGDLRKSGLFLVLFALFFPPIMGLSAIGIAFFLGLSKGDALLFTVLCASASYIAVPAAMRISVPRANMSLLLPMSLGITFTFNIALGIPLFFGLIKHFWS